ncbi:MAG: alpha-glucoside-specific PTS transporter subunit IIBC [Hungatella sp.]|jgi:PTS system arbutin-like IIC component|nr:alpha-glucoside-specific PTS transporter subunit IIBC [Hungatella sp.]
MKQKIQRFGAAMFVPVLFFAFYGMTVGISILFTNKDIMGSIAAEGTMWYNFWYIIQQGGWTTFNQLPLLFAVGLPVALAKKAEARACLEALIIYLTFNYLVGAILTVSGPAFGVDFSLPPGVDPSTGMSSGLAMIAGIKTLDTGMIGAILISGIAVYLHGKFYEKRLPDFLGIFQGSAFVAIMGFAVMIPTALIICLVWPRVQFGIGAMQTFLASSGVLGVWLYTFLERILIPTGLHHFVYGPFIFGPAVVPEGIASWWPKHLPELAAVASLKDAFPAGGFALHGLSKVFGCTGIALAIYATARPEKKKIVASLLIPATLTAILVGITEPLEFTFLFIAPALFAVHAVLAATLAATSYSFGVVGNFGGGLIDNYIPQNWLPLFKYHSGTYITQIVIGLIFTAIYFFVFRFLIMKFNYATPGREEDDGETKLFTKADYKAKKGEGKSQDKEAEAKEESQAAQFLAALGGSENIEDVTNCATRLRVSVKDETKLAPDSVFKKAKAHGVVRNGKAIQVIVGLSVPIVRTQFEEFLKK